MQAWGGSCAGLVFARWLSTRCCGGWGWRVAGLVHGAEDPRKGGVGEPGSLMWVRDARVGREAMKN